MAGVRDEKPVIEAAHERVGRTKHFMLKDAEKLFGQRVLADAVVMPERGKCAPAHMKRGVEYANPPRGEKHKKTMNTIQGSETHDF